ncbi:MAG: site-specific integrase [Desulfovibrio sp.]|uniref:tyrosine-type recombinase/integrase n=1 Tax=Desulfovibrio sp. TaxID=885 RepID=UPI0039E52D34
MQISLEKIRAARLRGDFSYEQPYHQAEYTLYPQIEMPAEETALYLSELIEKYCIIKIKDGAWVQRSLADHKNRVTSLLRIIGDKPINSVTRQDMRSFRDTLQKLPPRWREHLDKSGLSIDDFIEKHKNKTQLSIKSVNVTVEAISGMFTWAMRENLIERNSAQGLGIKDTQQDIEKRLPLSDDDIKLVFFNGDYKPGAFNNPAYYWVPLIALYTGMRLEEICQLHCEDIYEESGIFLIDIREESTDGLCDKILKTKNAKRKIPIHDELIKYGLISYRDDAIKNHQLRLFSSLKKTEKSPKYGKQVGKDFGLLLKEKRITDGKSFHSLRHSFSNFFKVRNMHTDMFRQVFGHEIQNLAGRQYGDKFSIKQIYEELISKISFDK